MTLLTSQSPPSPSLPHKGGEGRNTAGFAVGDLSLLRAVARRHSLSPKGRGLGRGLSRTDLGVGLS